MILLLYRRLLWCTDDIVKVPITWYSLSSAYSWQTRGDIFKKIPIFCYTVINNCRRTRFIDQQQQQPSVRNSCNHTSKRSKHDYVDNHTYLLKSIHVLFVGITRHRISVGYFYAVRKKNGGSLNNIYGTTLWSGDWRDWPNFLSRTATYEKRPRSFCFFF